MAGRANPQAFMSDFSRLLSLRKRLDELDKRNPSHTITVQAQKDYEQELDKLEDKELMEYLDFLQSEQKLHPW